MCETLCGSSWKGLDMKSSGIGGQAVIEGVMMRNGKEYAVAVRRPDGEIEVKKDKYEGIASRCALFRLPFIRGIFSFIDSLILGMDILNYSSSFYEEAAPEDGEPVQLTEKELARKKKKEDMLMAATMAVSVALAVGIFMLLPTWAASLIKGVFFAHGAENYFLTALLEGVIRVAIFIGYVAAIALMPDIKRVYMYHGSEHKCINCIEHGLPLTVENVRKSSKEHKRCGTSFLLYVVVISTIVVMFVHTNTLWLRMLSRILLLPVITGLSYEFLRLAGRSDSRLVNLLSRPGLLLQGLTTREPEDDMIEVAIASVEAVFDWKAYLRENFPERDFSDSLDNPTEDGGKADDVSENGVSESGRMTAGDTL